MDLTVAVLQLSSARSVYRFLRKKISFEQEEFWALALTSELKLLEAQCLFRGTVDQCPIFPRDIFRFALTHNSARLLISHSHPSGSALPSDQDIDITRSLLEASRLLQIPLEDHVIVARKTYYSFREEKTLLWP